MNTYLFPILIQIMGMIVIIAEIFIPSLGLLTLMALALFGYSLYLVFTTISVTAGYVFTGLDLLLVPFVIYMGIQLLGRSSLSLKRELSAKDGVASQSENFKAYVNMQGRAATKLRPAGMAMIGRERLDVVTDGEYIDKGELIVVTRVTGNQIIVEKSK